MALYYLDAQDANYPYQVVRKRLSDGGYVGQMPMSASLVAFSEGKVSGTAQVTVLPMGGLGSTTIQFNDYDWASCLPEPAAYSTDAEIMAYLSVLFTGQLGTLVPPTPTPNIMYYYTTPILNIDVRSAIPLFIPFSGGNGIPAEDDIDNYIIGFPATLDEVCATITTATLDDTVLIELLQTKAVIADVTIASGGIAAAAPFSVYADLVLNEPLYYKITSASTTGEISFSVRAKVTPNT